MAKHGIKRSKKEWKLIGTVALLVVLLLAAILLLVLRPNSRPEETPEASPTAPAVPTPMPMPGIESSASIAVPGYEALTLKANARQQEVSLHNPAQNTCYFVITLSLQDGTLLWQSEYIAPGENSLPIVLQQELAKGTYPEAQLSYACYRLDDLTPLNGANMKLSLHVK